MKPIVRDYAVSQQWESGKGHFCPKRRKFSILQQKYKRMKERKAFPFFCALFPVLSTERRNFFFLYSAQERQFQRFGEREAAISVP